MRYHYRYRFLLLALYVAATAALAEIEHGEEHGEEAVDAFELHEQGAVDLKQKIAALPFDAKTYSLHKLQVEVGIYLLGLMTRHTPSPAISSPCTAGRTRGT